MSDERLVQATTNLHSSTQPKYQIELPEWTGPYDVLLQVIDEQKLDLFNLDISKLLEGYLNFLESSPDIDLDEAGEFLVVAATLAQIKSKLLLPQEEGALEDEEKDPREDLVRYLVEYQKIRQAAEHLRERPLLGRDVFLKGSHEIFQGLEGDGRGTLFQLVKGFQKAVRELKAQTPFQLKREEIAVSDRLREIFADLRERMEIAFSEILGSGNYGKNYMIASFLAVLELVRLKKLKLRVSENPNQDEEVYLRFIEGSEAKDLLDSEFDETKAIGGDDEAVAEIGSAAQ